MSLPLRLALRDLRGGLAGLRLLAVCLFLLGRTKRPVANCRDCPKGDPGHNPETCEHLTCHGFYAATTDPVRIADMFDAIPDGLLAIRTGTASGLVVVDVDPATADASTPP